QRAPVGSARPLHSTRRRAATLDRAQSQECCLADHRRSGLRARYAASGTQSLQSPARGLSRHRRDRPGRPQHRAAARAGRAADRGDCTATAATAATATAAAAAAAGCELRTQLYVADLQLRWEQLDGTADGDVWLDLGRRYARGVRQDGIAHLWYGWELQRDPHGHG